MTRKRSVLPLATLLASFLIMQAAAVFAQDDQQPPPDQQQQYGNQQEGNQQYGNQAPSPDQEQNTQPDPPSRVARLNFSEGSVSFQPGGEGDWVQAVPNRPLTTGDNLWADQNSRAELHVGSTAIRMNSETSLTFLELDDRTTQFKLSMGTLILKVRHLDDNDLFEVDTPNLAFTIQRVGDYRIQVNPDGNQTITTVWRGRAEVTGGGESYLVVAGQQARFDGTDQLNHDINQLPPYDDFDNWAMDRDRREDHSESVNYISPEMTGAEDLDQYGSWGYAADYGPVWRPSGVPGGWAPYRNGHWAFVEPWGWTWVEDEPWGFAPFHYGRWAYVGAGWCWVPGPVVVRPVYAPALVAFVGGGGFGVGVGIGVGVSWFPLAPREVFVPWYRGSREYVNNVNITNTRVNVTQVTNVYNTTVINNNTTINNTNVTRVTYANQHVPSAITSVSHDTFVNARPVARNLAPVDAKLAQAPVTYRQPAQPARASVVGAGTVARVRPPAAVINRAVVATRNPTPPRPSFEQRQAPVVHAQAPTAPRPVTQGQGSHPQEAGRPQEPARPQTGAPQEAARPQGTPAQEQTRPGQPAPQRPNEAPAETARPQTPARETQPAPQTQQRPAPQTQERPVTPAQERPVPQAQERPTPQQARPVPKPPDNYSRGSAPAEQPHPLVRTAPPPQNRPEVQRNEEQKFNNWQRQRQNPAPRPAPRPSAPQQKNEPPHPPHR